MRSLISCCALFFLSPMLCFANSIPVDGTIYDVNDSSAILAYKRRPPGSAGEAAEV
jgi:hypothetical protein